MRRVNFSDWQEMALKKDIEQINKKLTSQGSILFSLSWELILALVSIIVDHIFADIEKMIEWFWIMVIPLAMLPAILILGDISLKWMHSVSLVKNGEFNVKKFVDIFDNQI